MTVSLRLEETKVAVSIDLSAPELHPEAVLQLILQHTTDRPPQNLLFKVSEEIFQFHKAGLVNVTAVSPMEAKRINAELGISGSPMDYLISGAEWRCSNCGRHLNFYDIFESGKGRHDNDFFQVFLGGADYHLQVAREGSLLEVACTECGTINNLEAPVHYTGTTYGYV